MGGVDRMDQNISTYKINLRSKKWWRPLFCFCIDVAVNNAFQLYCLRKLDACESKLDAIEFRRAIVEAYYLEYSTDMPQMLFPGSKSQPREHVRFSATNHWIVKGTQRRCAKPGCSGTSRYSCEACNVGLHPDCSKSTIYNRQCYLVGLVIFFCCINLTGFAENIKLMIFLLVMMLFVCWLVF